MNGERLLRIGWESSRNTFTVGNGNRPGVIPERGRDRETGTSSGYLAPAGGEAPSISYMEGASLFSRRQGHCARVPPPASPPSAIGKGCRLTGEVSCLVAQCQGVPQRRLTRGTGVQPHRHDQFHDAYFSRKQHRIYADTLGTKP
jgi:hypothetical protein